MRTKENGPDSMGRPYFSKFRSTWLGLGQTLDLPEKMSFSLEETPSKKLLGTYRTSCCKGLNV